MNALDEVYMAKAIQLAKQGHYTTHPNPRVGCVLVKDNVIVGEGFHIKAGEPHAERHALEMAGDKAQGATAYVTLEPCSHTGRTPPCADGLIEAKVARVVIGMQDPNPLVSGKGLEKLRQAGIEVHEIPILEASAKALNSGFIKRMQTNFPFVRCKMGMSIDGRTAMRNGESQWITGSDARQDVQFLRAQSSVILTGIGTALADDPSMNVRLTAEQLALPDGVEIRQPIKVLLDSQLLLPLDAKLLELSVPLWIFCGESVDMAKCKKLESQGAKIFSVAQNDNGLKLDLILSCLANEGINEVLVEAGAQLAGSFLQQDLVDELILYCAPVLLGDAARGLCHLPKIQHLSDKLAWRFSDVRLIGEDLRLTLTH